MTLLYRSPDVTVDGTRWHVTVQRAPRGGRAVRIFRWHAGNCYRPAGQWPGRLPKGLARTFRPYQYSVGVAMDEPVVPHRPLGRLV